MLVRIAYKPLINIEETTDFTTELTPQQVYEKHTELHGECVLIQLNGGDYLCRETEWNQPLKSTDTILIQVQPLRDPSTILSFVLNMMIKSFATNLIGAGGLLTATQAAILKAVVIMAGSMLVNQLLPQPSQPTPQKVPDPSPTYSLSGNFNTARLGQPVAKRYGEGWATPDLAMGSYNEYDAGDQIFHALFAFGTGEYNFLHAKLQDTDLTNFPDAQIEYAKPGQTVTLVPAQVYTASGVVSGNLSTDWTTASVSCPEEATVSEIGLDYVFGRGLGKFDNNGNIGEHSVTIEWQYRLVDDAGNALGAWTTLHVKSVTASTNSTVRGSEKVTIPSGRHEIQARRTEAEITDDNKVMDEVKWGGLRGYNHDHPDYGNVTMIALKVRVTEGNVQLVDNNTLQQLQVWYQAIIPVYDGTQWLNQHTRNPIWALHDAYTNSELGRKDPDTVPLDEWAAIAETLETKQHYFDYSFDQQIQLGEALQHIARAGRMKVYQHGGLLRVWRDEQRTLAKQVFNPDNTWNFSLSMQCASPDAPTGITVNYRNHATGKPAQITYSPTEDKSNLQIVDFTGCENNAHAFDEAAYLWQANSRNISGSFNTGLEAASLTYGDLIAVPSDETLVTAWGHIVYQVGNTLYLSNHHGLSGAAVMAIPSGGQMHYVDIVPATSDSVTATSALPAITTGASSQEPSVYIIGTVDHPIVLGHITKISPSTDDSATIEFTALEEIWDTPAPPEEPDSPDTSGLDLDCCDIKVRSEPDGTRFKLNISWREAPDAEYFVLGVNEGAGSWQRVYDGSEAATIYTTSPGAIQLRAAAFNQALGPFCYLDYDVGSVDDNDLPAPDGLALVGNFVCATLRLQIGLVKGAASYVWKIYSKAVGENPPVLRREINKTGDTFDYDWQMNREDGTGRDITVRVWSVDAAGNLSSEYTEGTFSNPQISGLTNIEVTGFTQSIFVRWDFPTDCDTLGAIIHASQTQGFTPSPSTFVGESAGKQFSWGVPHGSTWYVRIAGFDAWGQDNLAFSAEIEVTAQILNVADFEGELPASRIIGLLEEMPELAQMQADINQAKSDIDLTQQELDQAETNITNLQQETSGFSSSLTSLQFALSTETSARVADVLRIEAKTDTNTAGLESVNLAITDETSARVNQYTLINTQVGQNTADITQAFTAITDETNARTSAVASLAATVNEEVAQITTTQTAHADDLGNLTARYVLKVQAGSSWGGQIIQAVELPDGTGSVDVAYLADTFKVLSTVNGQPVQPFQIAGSTVGIKGELLVDGSVTAEALNVNQLSAVSADMGTITAGVIRNASWSRLLSLDATGSQSVLRFDRVDGSTMLRITADGIAEFDGSFYIRELTSQEAFIDVLHLKDHALPKVTREEFTAEVDAYKTTWRVMKSMSINLDSSNNETMIAAGLLLHPSFIEGIDGGSDSYSDIKWMIRIKQNTANWNTLSTTIDPSTTDSQVQMVSGWIRGNDYVPSMWEFGTTLSGWVDIELLALRSPNAQGSASNASAMKRWIRVTELKR